MEEKKELSKDFTNLSSHDIGTWIDEKEKELNVALFDQETVEEALIIISKDILTLQQRKKDLQLSQSKANHIVRSLSLELRRGRNAFFSARNSGL